MNTPRLPGLAFLAAFRAWTEEAINIMNGPILLIGSGIGLVSLLTDGAIANASFVFVLIWAISQAVGYDMQLLACAYRVAAAWRDGKRGVACVWAVFTLLLAVSVGLAAYVFSVQSSEHISEQAALGAAGFTYTGWLAFRAAGFVALVILAGATRYTPSSLSLPLPHPSDPEPTPSPVPLAPKRSGRRTRSHTGTSRASMTREQERRIRLATNILARGKPVSDRALARLLNCSPATASKVRGIVLASRPAVEAMAV